MAEIREPSEQLQSAIRDRDEAIAKYARRVKRAVDDIANVPLLTLRICASRRKKAVEMELAKCKIDIMSLNSQLLDAIQQKLNLSQQLEAWQVGQRLRVAAESNRQLHLVLSKSVDQVFGFFFLHFL